MIISSEETQLSGRKNIKVKERKGINDEAQRRHQY